MTQFWIKILFICFDIFGVVEPYRSSFNFAFWGFPSFRMYSLCACALWFMLRVSFSPARVCRGWLLQSKWAKFWWPDWYRDHQLTTRICCFRELRFRDLVPWSGAKSLHGEAYVWQQRKLAVNLSIIVFLLFLELVL